MEPKYLLSTVIGVMILGLVIGLIVFFNQSALKTDLPIQKTVQPVALNPEAGVTLAARYYASPGKIENKGVVLLHMLGSNQNAWNDFAEQLRSNNYEVMTFNFRGHGTTGSDWHEFTDQEYVGLLIDARDAVQYLHDLNPQMEIVLIGADIGANVALNLGADDTLDIQGIVALSPNNGNHGIATAEVNRTLNIPVYYIVSESDQSSFNDTKALYEAALNQNKQLQTYPKSGHGTKLLVNEPELAELLIGWLPSVYE